MMLRSIFVYRQTTGPVDSIHFRKNFLLAGLETPKGASRRNMHERIFSLGDNVINAESVTDATRDSQAGQHAIHRGAHDGFH
jgi:hypothetical protein